MREGKPIFLSIGYSAYHWCPVIRQSNLTSIRTSRSSTVLEAKGRALLFGYSEYTRVEEVTMNRTQSERELQLPPEATYLADLQSMVESLRGEPQYASNGRSGVMLVKGPEMRVVLQAMRPGSRLSEHHAPGPITVHMLEGEIEFSERGTVHVLHAGSLLSLPARIPHSVHAVHESVFLLTLVPLVDRE